MRGYDKLSLTLHKTISIRVVTLVILSLSKDCRRVLIINENFEKNIFTHIQFFLRNFFLANLIIESGQNNFGIGRSCSFQSSDFGFERTRCSGFAKERVVTFSLRNGQ